MINILKTLTDFKSIPYGKTSIGFAPTMGNLHLGHLSLVEKSLQENDLTIVSIFVNPTQFGQDEDFNEYPRTLEEDIGLLESLKKKYPNKNIALFVPKNEKVIYPKGTTSTIKAGALSNILEGQIRGTHFDGVVTVVHRLFEIVKPTRAYFGKKDYQQLTIIKQMVSKKNLDVEIIGLPIIREESGLAMSSRNGYLSSEEKENALALISNLNKIKLLIEDRGVKEALLLCNQIKTQFSFNYLEICQQKDLSKPTDSSEDLVILGNLQMGEVRLLDNIEVSL